MRGSKVGGLHVVVAVDHDGGPSGLVGILGHDDRVAGRLVFLDSQADALELDDEPVGAFVHLRFEGRVGRDAGELEKLDQVGGGVVVIG